MGRYYESRTKRGRKAGTLAGEKERQTDRAREGRGGREGGWGIDQERERERERERENEPSMYFRTKRIGESKGVRPWQRGRGSQGPTRIAGGGVEEFYARLFRREWPS